VIAAALATAVLAVTAPQVALRPAVTQLNATTTISVSGVESDTLQVLVAGATDVRGKQLPWQSLRRVHGVWTGTLPPPTLLGLYPIELRAAPGSPAFGSRRWLLRVLEPGTMLLPAFASPGEVARWWVRAIPRGRLTAIKAWPRPAFDSRDRRLHRLFVVAYQPRGTTARRDRLGIFVTAVRDGYAGRWRLLEASVFP
jgi:hypothetical protein